MFVRAGLLALSLVPALAAQEAAALRESVLKRIAAVPGAIVAVSFQQLGGGAAFSINEDSLFHAASTMKVAVLIEYFRALDSGRLKPGQNILLLNVFASIADGSRYALQPEDDSDSLVYARLGQRVPLRWLAERMIVRSSNLATNTLIEILGATAVDSTVRALGGTRMKVLRGVEDGRAFERGLNNVATAHDLALLLLAIAEGRAARPASCRQMIEILARQEFNDEIPAGLPPGTRVAHKTGWISGVVHDAGIVYPARFRPYVLVVLTRGIEQREIAQALIADISRLVWKAYGERPAK
jgi:beta-lactamase class A